jgi:hypothetical protein
VALVRTDVSEALSSSESSILARATRRNIQEDTILHSDRRENLKSYIRSSYGLVHNDYSFVYSAIIIF